MMPTFSYNNNKNVTYEKFLGVYVADGDTESVMKDSWVMFSSKMFSLVHCVKISTVRHFVNCQATNALINSLGASMSIFFEDDADNSIKVDIDSINVPESFWVACFCQFTDNG